MSGAAIPATGAASCRNPNEYRLGVLDARDTAVPELGLGVGWRLVGPGRGGLACGRQRPALREHGDPESQPPYLVFATFRRFWVAINNGATALDIAMREGRDDAADGLRETLPWFPLYVLPYPVSRLCHAFPVLRPARALTFQIPLCCFSLSPVGSPRDLTGLFRRRIAWEDGAIREPTGAGAVAFLMNRRCSNGEDVGARASSVGKRWGSASFSRACPHAP